MPTLTDADKVLRNDVGKRMATALEAIAQGGGGGASVVQKTMAEYTALPSSEKMNGSIYKITDKALIYCLDEEYHAVLEITSADYALLTSDEKNNGTLYILTDEETTAADIPMSSSDNTSVASAMEYYKDGDTVDYKYGYFNGHIQGASEIYFFIPLRKKTTGLTPTITGEITIYGVDGILRSDMEISTDATVTYYPCDAGLLAVLTLNTPLTNPAFFTPVTIYATGRNDNNIITFSAN